MILNLSKYYKILLYSVICIIFFNLIFAITEFCMESYLNANLNTVFYLLISEIITGLFIFILSIVQSKKMKLNFRKILRIRFTNNLLYLIPLCILLGFLLHLIGGIFNEFFSKLFPLFNYYDEIFSLIRQSNSFTDKFILFISIALIPGITEEILFRGFIYSMIRRYSGISIGIILTTLFFLILHPIPTFFPTYLIINTVLCITLEYSENLLVPVVIHVSVNSFALLT